MRKILFGTKQQAQDWADLNDLRTISPVAVNLTGFESGEGAPDTFSGETNALPATDMEGNIVAYLAYWTDVEEKEEGVKFINLDWYVGNIFPLPTIRGKGGKRIATITKDLPIEERESYAHLIAAAPKMYKALREYVELTKQYVPVHSKAAFCQLKCEKILKEAAKIYI